MDISSIFAAQTVLKETIEAAIAEFKLNNPEVTRVSMAQDYTPEGEVIRLVIDVESNGESITRKV